MVIDGTTSNVRFGSEADICSAKSDVRFAPNSDRKSGHQQTVMSALPLKADMCSALAHVRLGHLRTKSPLTHSTQNVRRSGANEALGRLRTKICVLQAPRQIGFVRRGLKYNFPLGERIDPIRDGQRLLD